LELKCYSDNYVVSCDSIILLYALGYNLSSDAANVQHFNPTANPTQTTDYAHFIASCGHSSSDMVV